MRFEDDDELYDIFDQTGPSPIDFVFKQSIASFGDCTLPY